MKTCELFFGRMQPIHSGHAKIIQGMKNPVVVVVKGEKSSLDKKRNPLDAEYQIKLLKKVAPKAKIIQFGSGYLPDIIEHVRSTLNLEPTAIYAGPDRLGKYKGQVDSANKTLENKINIQYKEAERVTSATVVREAIRSGDEKAFKANVPQVIWDEFSKLQKLLEESKMEIKSFKEWLSEEQVKATYDKAPGDKAPDMIAEPDALKHDKGAGGEGDGGARKERANQLENGDKKADKIKEPKEHKIDAGKGPESMNKLGSGQAKAEGYKKPVGG